MPTGPAQPSQSGNHFARQHRQPRSLPPPDELASRIEEAKTTAKLLSQTVQSTPSTEIPSNDLIKEFADRASSASRSIQGYIHSTNPAPDEDTLLTLIETNDQLSFAMSKHQRALLQARRALGGSPPDTTPSQADQVYYAAPQGPPPGAIGAAMTQDHNYPPRSPPQRAQEHVYVPNSAPSPQRAPFVQQQQHQHQQQPQPAPAPAPSSQHLWQREQTSNYDVPENPFVDEAQQADPPKKLYGLFNRSNAAGAPSGLDQHPSQAEPVQDRAQNHMPHYQPSPSHVQGQEAAMNNLTAPGRVPPPDLQGSSGAQQRMTNMGV